MKRLSLLSCLFGGLLLGSTPAIAALPMPVLNVPSKQALHTAGLLADEPDSPSPYLLQTKAGHGGPCVGSGGGNLCNPGHGPGNGGGGKPGACKGGKGGYGAVGKSTNKGCKPVKKHKKRSPRRHTA
ncbi:MAG TPA: hypothetical protein VNN09_03915 [Candidatus Competibacteraceae bacterium]|nr:hypothetical protein [Candidatus Competibacteraceae bacterium]